MYEEQHFLEVLNVVQLSLHIFRCDEFLSVPGNLMDKSKPFNLSLDIMSCSTHHILYSLFVTTYITLCTYNQRNKEDTKMHILLLDHFCFSNLQNLCWAFWVIRCQLKPALTLVVPPGVRVLTYTMVYPKRL